MTSSELNSVDRHHGARSLGTGAAAVSPAEAASPLLLAAAVLLGLVVRSALVARVSFPINDGGLFFVMIEELRRAHFVLPAFTSYNGDTIPYAYPPLGFYVSALLAEVLGASVIDLLRLVPVAVGTATIVAFNRLARAMVEPVTAAAATFAFALVPAAFAWPSMGGGITRGFGLLFTVLALDQGYRLYVERQAWRVVPTALFCGLTVLSHPAYTWCLVYSMALLWVWFGRDRASSLLSLLVCLGTLVVSAPWWVTIVVRHGL
ncbi:MAG: hypothetical protein QJR03_15595 [Sphaerobacter sp.]|nr:hypothetical protein [Sphaerobacter sp.]